MTSSDQTPDSTSDFTPDSGRSFTLVDLSGARFHKVHLNDARFRMVDLSGAVLRDVSLAGASIDGAELAGLRIDGVEVAPLIEAALVRRDPARALRHAADPASLREAWPGVERSWAEQYDRVARLPAAAVDVRVDGEWSFAQTLRHLVFVTDGWLGAARGGGRPFHPWGLPFTDLAEFADPADLGVDPDAHPSYAELVVVRAERVAQVRDFLADVTADQLRDHVTGPAWYAEQLTVQQCLSTILTEELDHLRFARRDLDAVQDLRGSTLAR